MALPKRRQSKSRGRKRRTHYKSSLQQQVVHNVVQAKNLAIMHIIIMWILYYKGNQLYLHHSKK